MDRCAPPRERASGMHDRAIGGRGGRAVRALARRACAGGRPAVPRCAAGGRRSRPSDLPSAKSRGARPRRPGQARGRVRDWRAVGTMTEALIGPGEGTPEAHWLQWLADRAIPDAPLAELAHPSRRVLLVAPHPDDEVLAAGGMLSMIAAHWQEPLVIAVTDGTASHP